MNRWLANESLLRAGRLVGTAIAIVLLWYGAMAAVFRMTEQAPGALVPFPDRHLAAGQLPAGITILKWNSYFAVVASDEAAYVGRLYAAGVPVVFPARSGGCLSYRGTNDPAQGKEKPDWQGNRPVFNSAALEVSAVVGKLSLHQTLKPPAFRLLSFMATRLR